MVFGPHAGERIVSPHRIVDHSGGDVWRRFDLPPVQDIVDVDLGPPLHATVELKVNLNPILTGISRR